MEISELNYKLMKNVNHWFLVQPRAEESSREEAQEVDDISLNRYLQAVDHYRILIYELNLVCKLFAR